MGVNLTTALDFVAEGQATLGRWRRRAASRLRFPRLSVVYHCNYASPEHGSFDSRRSAKILNYLIYEGCIKKSDVMTPRWATIGQLNQVHPFSYLANVTEAEQITRVFGHGVTEQGAEAFIEQQRWMVGGTIKGAREAISLLGPRVVVNLGGGFHHAYADAGYGFCVFNDVAIAIAHLRRSGYTRNILIIDLDLHQGDGTRRIFADDPTVFTFSLHAENWDDQPYPGDFNVALGPGIGDIAYLNALREHLPDAIAEAQPHLVIYVAGVDIAADDKMGNWRVSHQGIFARDRLVMDCVGKRPLLWLLSGGYGADAWRHSARSLAWLAAEHDAPIASETERHLQHMRSIARAINVSELVCEEAADPFYISPDDLLPNAPKVTRFLGFYSSYGLECAMERYGIFPHIRSLGVAQPKLTLDLNHPTGQLVRVVSEEDGRQELFVEMVLDERLDLPPFRILWLEWLLLQNPRGTFTEARPLLPGQTHPGLGCLRKVIGMLFMACERLHFDGVAYNPAHFHSCAIAKGDGSFADPDAEARYRVAEVLCAGMTLEQASRALAEGSIVDAAGQPFKWQPARLCLPVSRRMRAHFESPAYQQAVELAAATYRERFEPLSEQREHLVMQL